MSANESHPMHAVADAVSDVQSQIMRLAVDLCGGNHDLAAIIVRAAATDMEAIQRADFIGAVYAARKARAEPAINTEEP